MFIARAMTRFFVQKLGGSWSQETTRAGQTKDDSKFYGDSDIVSACVCVQGEEGLNKEKIASTSASIRDKTATSVLVMSLENSVLSRMSVVPFELLPQC